MRTVFLLLVCGLISRWVYREIQLVMPGAVPYLNDVLEYIDPPTHDKIIEMFEARQGERHFDAEDTTYPEAEEEAPSGKDMLVF
jgi:hypothetical protein